MPALITYRTPVQADWVDYHGHRGDADYLLSLSYATDALMEQIGLDADARGHSGHSLLTLEAHINYLHEVKLGSEVWVQTHILGFDSKRLHLYHSLHRADLEQALAASEQMLLHVDQAGPSAAPFSDYSRSQLQAMVAAQAPLPADTWIGRTLQLPGKKNPDKP